MKSIRSAVLSRPTLTLSLATLALVGLFVIPLEASGGNFVSIYVESGAECKWDAHINGALWNPTKGSDRQEEAAAGAALLGIGTFLGVRPEGAAHKLPTCRAPWTNFPG
jgi:hypothetical protein